MQRHFLSVQRHLAVRVLQTAADGVIFHGGNAEHLAHRRQAFDLLIGEFGGIGRLIAFQTGDLSHKLRRHIHRDHHFAVQGLHHAIQAVRQGLRRSGHLGRIFQQNREVEGAFAFGIAPAQRRDGHRRVAFEQDRQRIEQRFGEGLLIQLRILRQLRFRQQRLRLRAVLLTELVPRLTVDVIHFQREFAAAHILPLQLEAVDGVVHLAVHAFAVLGQRRAAVQRHAVDQRQLFAFDADGQFIEGHFLLADTFVEAGQLGGAVGGQVDEAQLYLLIIFVERIDLPAAGLALQADVFAVAVGVELELTAAEGNFLIAFSVVEGVKDDSRLAVAAVGNARIDGKGGVAFGYLEQRLAGVVFHQRGVDGRHCRRQIKGF